MSNPIPTVRVKTDAEDNPDGFIVINATDFNEDVHVLHESNGTAPVKPQAPPAPPAVPKKGVAELRAYLDSKDIAYDPAAKRADLQALYDADQE